MTASRLKEPAKIPTSRRINSCPGVLTLPAGQAERHQGSVPKSKYKYRKVIGGKPSVSRSMSTSYNEMSPQDFLDRMMKSRGYCTRNFCSLEGAYYCKPTLLQKASYGIQIVRAVRGSNVQLLRKLLQCGLSPNPCNNFGESIVHMACRRGDYDIVKVLVDAGCSLQVTDDFGRTPLHDACWTAEPNFALVELILQADERLLHIVDCRGSSPLSYVKRDHWQQWIVFLDSHKDLYWPQRDLGKDGEEPLPPLVTEAPHSRPIKDPPNAASLELAEQLAAGKLGADAYLTQRLIAAGTSNTTLGQNRPTMQQTRQSSTNHPAPASPRVLRGARISKAPSIAAAMGISIASSGPT